MNQVMVRLSYTEVSLGLDFILSAEQAIKSMPMLTLVDGESGYPEREFKRCLAAESSA